MTLNDNRPAYNFSLYANKVVTKKKAKSKFLLHKKKI